MYPYDILPGIDLYGIMLCAGIIAAMLTFRIFSDRRCFSAKLNNFVLADGVMSIVAGYGSAVLFQAFYNAAESGRFEITKNTGATFYGGFIGGAAVFFAFYLAWKPKIAYNCTMQFTRDGKELQWSSIFTL